MKKLWIKWGVQINTDLLKANAQALINDIDFLFFSLKKGVKEKLKPLSDFNLRDLEQIENYANYVIAYGTYRGRLKKPKRAYRKVLKHYNIYLS